MKPDAGNKVRISLPDQGLVPRWQAANVSQCLEFMRVVMISGARQAGKSTLARHFADGEDGYRSLDDERYRQGATQDPATFVRHDLRTLVIDEVQKVPQLLSEIKLVVDTDQRRGRYLLTGSADLSALPDVRESLAGRALTVRLRPLARGEMLGNPPAFLHRAFDLSFRDREGQYSHFTDPEWVRNRDTVLSSALAGGYPEALAEKDAGRRRRWFQEYVAKLLSRDLREISRIRRKKTMETLVLRLAAWSSNTIDLARIGKGLDVSRETLNSYVNALEAMYLVDRVPAWIDTDYERGYRRDKLFMSDSGLMGGLLRWDAKRVQIRGDVSGKLLETYVHNQLAALVDVHESDYELFHFRDHSGREIDFVVRNANGDVLGIEVKAATTVEKATARHLQWFGDNLVKTGRFVGLVLHTGGGVHRLSDNVWAVPVNDLWE